MKKYDNIRSQNIPPYISCRSYEIGTKNSKTFISNERTHEYLILDGLSSDIWYKILNDTSAEEMREFLKVNRLEDCYCDFINELVSADLLILDKYTLANIHKINPMPAENNAEEVRKIYKEMKKWAFKHNRLFSVKWEATYECNQRCIHCYNPNAKERNINDNSENSELTTLEAKKMIDEVVAEGCFNFIFTGGEVFTRPDIFELIEYAKQKRLCVDIYTNGLILENEDVVRRIAALWIKSFDISVYSHSKDIHENITRIKDSFNKTVNALSNLNKYGINTNIKTPLMEHTCTDYKSMNSLSQSVGTNFYVNSELIPNMNLKDKKRNAPMDLKVSEGRLILLYLDKESPMYLGEKYITRIGKPDDIICEALSYSVSIDPYGNIKPCIPFPTGVGNIKEQSFKEIWEGDKLKAFKKMRQKDIKHCGIYDYCEYCLKPCPALNMLETGDPIIPGKNIFCDNAKIRQKAVSFMKNKTSLQEIRELYAMQ